MNLLLGREEALLDVAKLRPRYEGKQVLVTGGAGSIGSQIVRTLASLGASPVILDHSESGIARLTQSLDVKYELADVRFTDDLRRVFTRRKYDHVIHAAAYKHVPILEKFRFTADRNNVQGTRNVLDHATCPVTLISTDKAVEPSSHMGITKRQAELKVLEAGGTVVRFGNVLNSSGSVLEIWENQLLSNKPLTVTDMKMQRFLMTLQEAAGLVLHVAGNSGVYVLQMGDRVSVGELVQRFLRSKCRSHHPICDIGPRPGEKLVEKLHSDVETLHPTDHPAIYKVNS